MRLQRRVLQSAHVRRNLCALLAKRYVFGHKSGVVDAVGDVERDALGVHAECRGDEFGVGGVDQGGQSGAPHRSWWDPGRVQQVAEVGGRGGLVAGLGAAGDD